MKIFDKRIDEIQKDEGQLPRPKVTRLAKA